MRYDIAGSVVAKIDPLNRKVAINYADVFNDNLARNSFAYPTTLTDPAGNFSTVKYRYDIGANVRAQSPAPQGQSQGKITERIFDSLGRLQKDLIVNSGAYTRYEYPMSGIQSKVFSTVIDTNNNGADTADEVLSESWADGAGRVVRSRTEHPGSVGGWSGTIVEYDTLGQAKRSSVPTEISVSNPNDPNTWTPAGDDASRGWTWKSQEYDWMGRVTREINTDGTDTLAEYSGCGCADSIVTLKGELLTEGRRTQKVYSDSLGREIKREMLDWQGIVYKTATNQFNGRDQTVSSRVYAGLDTATEYQETTAEFDGHGRLKRTHAPEQDINKFTTYTYSADDKPQTITDARGAVKHYLYNNRGLIDEISWTVPQNSPIEIPVTVTFNYDNVGNRISMADGFGTVAYEYNSLSQVTAETRQFNQTVPTAPMINNQFKIQYAYGLAGQLSSLTEPYGEVITYGFDKTGRLKSVSGNRTNLQLDYITNAQYRAWGAVKQLRRGSTPVVTLIYNNRLQAIEYSGGFSYLQYGYYNDGRLKSSDTGQPGTFSDYFDRSYEYDLLGRLTSANTGAEARGEVENDPKKRPYRLTNEYNRFGDIVAQQRKHWVASFTSAFQYENGRTTNETNSETIPNWVNSVDGPTPNVFDADGRKTGIENEYSRLKYDADGRLVYSVNPIDGRERTRQYDGDGRIVKSYKTSGGYSVPVFHIVSSVLGEEVSRVWIDDTDGGVQRRVKVYANGKEIAERRMIFIGSPGETDATFLKLSDPSGVEADELMLHNSGTSGLQFLFGGGTLDPYGAGVGYSNPYPDRPDYNYPECDYGFDGEPSDPCDIRDFEDPDNDTGEVGSFPEKTCYKNGFEGDCNDILNNLDPDTPVTKDDEFPDRTPSDNGPQGIHQNSDPTDNSSNGDAGEREFEQQYTGSSVWFGENAGVSMNISPNVVGTVSDWDLRNETLPNPESTPRKETPKTDCNNKVLVEVGVSDSGDGATSKRPYMNEAVVNDFNAAINEILEGGLFVGFNELFRPFAVQVEYWTAYKNNGFKPIGRIAKAANTDRNGYPGPSNHGAGFSFDIMIRNRGVKPEEYDPHYARKLNDGPNKGRTVEQIFNNLGFFRNEPNDQPHFNYKRKPSYAEKLAAQNYFRDCLGDKY